MNEREVVKLSINSAALERLIGGDSEVEIKIRHQILDNFAKAHIKPLINDKLLTELREEIKSVVDVEVKEQLAAIRNGQTGSRTERVVEDICTSWPNSRRIANVVDEYLTVKFQKAIDDRVATNVAYILKDIDKRINAVVDTEIEKRIKDGITERLQKAAAL